MLCSTRAPTHFSLTPTASLSLPLSLYSRSLPRRYSETPRDLIKALQNLASPLPLSALFSRSAQSLRSCQSEL